jgi:hypothetical protein
MAFQSKPKVCETASGDWWGEVADRSIFGKRLVGGLVDWLVGQVSNTTLRMIELQAGVEGEGEANRALTFVPHIRTWVAALAKGPWR